MTGRPEASGPPLAVAFGVALLAGILVDWSPHYWRVGVAVAAITVVGAVWALTARRIALPLQTILIVPIALWAPMQLSLHLTHVPWLTTQRSIEWAMCAVCFILGSQVLAGRRSREAFLNLMLGAVTFLAVAAMLQMYVTPDRVFGFIPVGANVVGTMYYKNWFAAIMELAAPIALWQVYNGKVLAGGLCFAAMFAATIASESRMGVILLLAEALVVLLTLVAGRRMRMKSAVSMVVVLALLMAAAAEVVGTDKILTRLQESQAYQLRGTLLASTMKMMPRHPWLGSGMGTWPSEYPGFATYDMNVYVNAAHNDWAQWVSEGGLPFLLLMIAMGMWLVRPSVRSVWGLGVVTILVHSYMDYPVQDPAVAFFWFTMAGAAAQGVAKTTGHRSRRASDSEDEL